MPITLNSATGTIEAALVDDNFGELENLLKENVSDSDFNGKFDKYKIRRYTSGRIVGFNSGSRNYTSSRPSAVSGTFENNWISGTPAITYLDHEGKSLQELATVDGRITSLDSTKNDMNYSHPLQHPFELLGYPGGSLYYDFQEQGFADPDSYYQALYGASVSNWPPPSSPLKRFPSDECWSRWLTIPDAAGGVYVDEPCVALITAQVHGNYFFTPSLRVHGTNTSANGNNGTLTLSPDYDDIELYTLTSAWKNANPIFPGHAGVITEGMQHSAHLRLGLFADTNPIVWDDEFFNGNSFGNVSLGSGHGYNPWIGSDPTGQYQATRPDGVAKSRSWVKVTDLTCRVRQRGSYKIIGAIALKGRRRYNFSMKFRPAMTFGHVNKNDQDDFTFRNSYYEISPGSVTPQGENTPEQHNPGWYWGPSGILQTPEETYFYPGGDALVTNLIESSALSVQFFYGQSLTNVREFAQEMIPNWDPGE